MSRTRKVSVFAVGAAVLGSVFVTAPPASAGAGTCNVGYDACLFYHSNARGAYHGMAENGNYDDRKFGGHNGNSNGKGQGVWNNAASVANTHPKKWLIVYWGRNQNCKYACDPIAPGAFKNLSAKMKNENASQSFSHVRQPGGR